MSATDSAPSTSAPPDAAELLREATEESVSYAVLRGREVLFGPDARGRSSTVTVLADARDVFSFERLAYRHGWTVGRSAAGDLELYKNGADDGTCTRVNVVDGVRYGGRHRWLTTDCEVGRQIRRADLVESVRIVSLADELVDALLHCLLDLGAFPPAERRRVRDLMRRLRERPVLAGRAAERVQQELAPALGWGWLLAAIVTEQWEAILDRRGAVRRHLARRAPVSSAGRWAAAWTRSTRIVPASSGHDGGEDRRAATHDGGDDDRDRDEDGDGDGGRAGAPAAAPPSPVSATPAAENPSGPGVDDASNALTERQLRGSSLLLAGRGLSTAFKFVAELIVVRYLATSEYGAWTYALAAVVFLRGMSMLGLNRAVSRFVPIHLERNEHRDLAGVVTFVMGLLLLSCATVVTAFYAFPDWVARIAGISEQQPIEILFVLILLVPIEAADEFLTGICATFTDSKTIFVRRYLLNPSLRLSIAVLLVLLQANVRFLAWGYLVAGLAGVVYYTWSVVGGLRRRGLLSRGILEGLTLPVRRVLSYTVPAMGADWCAILLTTTSPLLLGYFTEMSEVALFQVVVPLVAINRLVAQSFGVLFEPSAARMLGRDHHDELNQLYWRSALWVAVLSFPAFAVSFTAAEPLTVLLFGDRYAEAAPILSLLAVGYFVDAMLGFNSAILRVAGQVKLLLAVNVAAATLNVILHVVLIPRMGALGAGIATATSWVLYGVMKQVALHATAGVRGFETGLLGAYGMMGLAAVALLVTRIRWPGSVWIVGGAAVLASLAVLARARAELSIVTTFPELARYPLIRRIVR